jgi:hypothetical protein
LGADVWRDNDKGRNDEEAHVLLVSETSPRPRRLTPTTIYRSTRRARYSTPPSSSICSSVKPVNRLFLPTVAANEM